MTPQTDLFGQTPKIGDIIVWNPAKYKGLIYGTCVGFAKSSSLPEVEIDRTLFGGHYGQSNSNGRLTPKTGFVIKGAL